MGSTSFIRSIERSFIGKDSLQYRPASSEFVYYSNHTFAARES